MSLPQEIILEIGISDSNRVRGFCRLRPYHSASGKCLNMIKRFSLNILKLKKFLLKILSLLLLYLLATLSSDLIQGLNTHQKNFWLLFTVLFFDFFFCTKKNFGHFLLFFLWVRIPSHKIFWLLFTVVFFNFFFVAPTNIFVTLAEWSKAPV
jgi:hypothetical protein